MAVARVVVCLLLVGRSWADTGYFWQINDFHYDPTYDTTGDSCNPARPPGPRGQYGDVECDPPWKLVEAAVTAMNDLAQGHPPDFIFWLGDNVHHPLDHHTLSEDIVIEMITNTSRLLQSNFPNTPVYASLGNHDYYPVNDLPGGSSTIYDATAQVWSRWLVEQQAVDRFKSGAFYSLPLTGQTNKRVVVANTNLYNTGNSVTQGDSDPGGQFVWLEETLGKARTDGEKVYLVIHIPSGYLVTGDNVKWFTDDANTRFNNIIRQYADILLGVFTSHEHTDSFRVFYKQGTPSVPMFIAPAVTPWRARLVAGESYIYFPARNPAVRRYKYDKTTGHLLDYEQFMLDLPQANSGQDTTWKLQYTFSQAYNQQDLSAASLDTLLQDFKKDDSEYFTRYLKYVYVSSNHSSVTDPGCGCTCKKQYVCGMEEVDVQGYVLCLSQGTLACVAGASSFTISLGLQLFIMALVSVRLFG